MLGGRDFDRLIVDNLVRPWLLKTFDLPDGFQADKRYERLIRTARVAAERAKIDLSTRERTTINASDEIVRLEDRRGEPIYLDVPVERSALEDLVAEKINLSLEQCRKALAENGLAGAAAFMPLPQVERYAAYGRKPSLLRAASRMLLSRRTDEPRAFALTNPPPSVQCFKTVAPTTASSLAGVTRCRRPPLGNRARAFAEDP